MNHTEKPQISFADPPTRISCRKDLDQGLVCLCEIDPVLCSVTETIVEAAGPIPLRLRPAGFAGMAEIVVGQQVSKASAAAIFKRLSATVVPLTAETYLATGGDALIETGLSRAKQVALLGLAKEVSSRRLDLHELTHFTPKKALERLVLLKGIGPWTAEVLPAFCVGHADIFPAGDIALQQAIADIYGLEKRPNSKAADAFAERWSPVRGVAARVLWAQYAHMRKRSILPV